MSILKTRSTDSYKALLMFVMLALVFLFAGRSSSLNDPGTFFHTAVGEKLLDEKRCVWRDEFTWQFEGKPWIAQQWLGEVFMALLHRTGGFDSIFLFFCLLMAIIYSWLCRGFWNAGMNTLLVIFLLVFTLNSTMYHFLLRPHIFSIAFMCLIFNLLMQIENQKIALKGIGILPPIIILWSNIHGGVLGGLGTIGLVFAGWLAMFACNRDSPLKSFKDARFVIIIGFLCFISTLVNPYGFELVKTWVSIMESPAVAAYVDEHKPLLRVSFGWQIFLWGVFYLVSLVGACLNSPHKKVVWFIPMVWFFLTLGRIRHASIFAAVAAVAFADMYPFVRWFNILRQRGSVLFKEAANPQQQFWKPVILVFVLLSLAGFTLQANGQSFSFLGSGWIQLDESHWPVSNINDLREFARYYGPDVKIFNEMLFGGFLTFNLPEIKVFIDDRCELSGEAGLIAYVELIRNPLLLKKYEERFALRGALTSAGSPFDKYFKTNPSWRLRSISKAASFYERIPEG